MLKCKKITAFFLACLMLLGTIVPIGDAFAQGANELTKTRVSRIEVKDRKGNTIDLNEKIEEDKDCRLEIDWDASEYGADIKEGDYFNVTLPKGFKASKSNFAVRTLDGVQVAKAQVNNLNSELGGGTLKVVFTSLAEDKTDVKGSIAIEGSTLHKNKLNESNIAKLKSPTYKESSISVKKIWKNEKGFEIDAPEEKIEVELYKNGVTTGEKLKLTKENNWIGVFDVSGTNDELAEYSVKEIGESKHSVLINDNRYRVIYEGDAKNGFVVTNKVSKGIVSYAKIPFGKMIILPTVSPEKEKENLLDLMNDQPDSWTFKYKLEELKDKDTVIKTYDYITLTVENLVKTNKQDFYDDLSYYLDREVTSLDDLNNQEISRAYTLARQYLFSGYGYAEFYLEDKILEEIDGYTEDYLFRVTELPSEYSDIVDDQYNERYYYVKTTIENDGTYQTYWNCAESYEKLDREDNAQNRQDNLFEIFKSFTGEDLKEYMGYDTTSVRQAQSLPSRCAFYNKLKKAEDKKISIPVKKIWKNTDGTEIDSVEEKVEVELYKDGKATGKVVTLNDANEWTASFGQIEDTENSSVSKYTVKEIGEKDGRIEITNDAFLVTYSGDIENGFTVENKYINERGLMCLLVNI